MRVDVCMVVHQNYYQDARVIRYVEALAARGMTIDVLCLRGEGGEDRDREGVRVFQIPLRKKGGQRNIFVEYVLALVLFTGLLLRRYLRHRYRVIHVHNMPDFLVFTALIPRLLGAKLVLDIHDPMPEFYMSKYAIERPSHLMVRLMRWQERLSAQLAQAVITANSAFKANLEARGIAAEKLSVVNNVADRRLFDPAQYDAQRREDRSRFTLIYAGTIAARYGLHIAVEAVPHLIADIPDLHLCIIGPESAEAERLKQRVRELHIAGSVDVLPAIPLAAVPERMARADVGIYCALPDPHMAIATPSKTLEYAAMHLPIVSARLPAVEAIFTPDEVMFFPPGDVRAFADCILTLYRQPEKRRALVENLQAGFLQRNAWEHECAAYWRVLHGLHPERFALNATTATPAATGQPS